jgi:hypothetical protein
MHASTKISPYFKGRAVCTSVAIGFGRLTAQTNWSYQYAAITDMILPDNNRWYQSMKAMKTSMLAEDQSIFQRLGTFHPGGKGVRPTSYL